VIDSSTKIDSDTNEEKNCIMQLDLQEKVGKDEDVSGYIKVIFKFPNLKPDEENDVKIKKVEPPKLEPKVETKIGTKKNSDP